MNNSGINFTEKWASRLINSELAYTIWFSIFLFVMPSGIYGQVDTSFDLYLLIGQSNMAGRGEITDEYLKEGHPNVYMLDEENNWVLAKHPLHFDKPKVAGVGPGLSFGIEMAQEKPGHKIGLIPCAVGGTSINVWKPGALDNATITHPYDHMMLRLQNARQYGVLKGVLWLQGEADSSPDKAAKYLVKLEKVIERIRTKVQDPDLPFVAGELGRFKKQYQNINTVIKDLPDKVPNTAIVSSKGLKDKGDKTHFDAGSAEEMGKRFARQMKRLQN